MFEKMSSLWLESTDPKVLQEQALERSFVELTDVSP